MSASAIRGRYLALTALRWLPVGAVAPLLILTMTERGIDLAQVGFVLVPYGIVVVALELPTGGLADAFGRRRVLIAASAVDVVAYTAFAVAQVPIAFAVVWGISGVARALHSGPLEAWFVDATRAATRPDEVEGAVRRGLAHGGSAEALALAVGSVVSGFVPPLLDGLPADPQAVLTPLSGPVLLAAALAAVNGLALMRLLREPRRRSTTAVADRPGPVRLVREGAALAARSADVRLLLLASGGVGLALVAFELYWQPRLVELLGLPAQEATAVLGPLLAGVFGAAALGSALAPTVARLLGGPARGAVAGYAVHALGLGLAGLTRSPAVAAACFLLAYVANGWDGVLHRDLLHARVGKEHRSVVLSAHSLAIQGGGLAAKLVVVAPVAGALGVPAAWGVAAAALALCGVWVLGLARPRTEPATGGDRPPRSRRPGRASSASAQPPPLG